MRLSSFALVFLLSAATEAFVPGWTSAVSRRPIGGGVVRLIREGDVDHLPSSSRLIMFAKKKVNAKLAALEALEALESQANPLEDGLSLKELQEMEKKKKKQEKVAAETVVAAAAGGGAAAGGKKNAKAAALAALEGLEDELDQPLSKKELKKQAKGAPTEPSVAAKNSETEATAPSKLSAKEEKLRRMMEMEAMDSATQSAAPVDEQPALSKKELKALMKKEQNMAAKQAAKAEKKAQRTAEVEETVVDEVKPIEAAVVDEVKEEENDEGPTLEDKIRKERPPPRVRVMESSQPGFVSLRLEKVGITFRNQEVLKDVTWGVQSGDRIG